MDLSCTSSSLAELPFPVSSGLEEGSVMRDVSPNRETSSSLLAPRDSLLPAGWGWGCSSPHLLCGAGRGLTATLLLLHTRLLQVPRRPCVWWRLEWLILKPGCCC